MRKTFLAGIFVLLPILITFWLLNWLLSVLDRAIYILPPSWRPEAWLGVNIPGIGTIIAIAIILLVGALARNFMGRQFLSLWEWLLSNTPVVRSVYKSVKQISDTLLSSDGQAFRRPVLVNYPHQNSWSIAFVTGNPGPVITNQLDAGPYISVFIPTTPNPTSGFFLIVPEASVKSLPISVDQALRYIVSMGVINVVEEGKEALPGSTLPPEQH